MKILLLALSVVMAGLSSTASANADLARQKNCLACHAIDKKLMGPAFNDVAAKYAGQSGAIDALATKIMKGGAGVWGTFPMPPNAVTAAEAKQLSQWVLGLGSGASKAAPSESSSSPAPVKTQAAPAARRDEPRADAQTIRHGRYLVESVLGCGNCHSPRAADNTVIAGRELSGGRTYDTQAFYVTPGNLTPDPETGLGRWSAEDIKRALTQGVRPNGLPLAPMMPVAFYKAMMPRDLDAVVAYLKALPAVRNPTPAPIYRQAPQHAPYPDAERPYEDRRMAVDQIERGRYLAALGHCLDCHTPMQKGTVDYERDGGRGGRRVGLERIVAPNITSHPTAGLGSWTDAEIGRALAQGLDRGGRRLRYPMPWPFLAKLNKSDLDAMVAWLRSLPPRE